MKNGKQNIDLFDMMGTDLNEKQKSSSELLNIVLLVVISVFSVYLLVMELTDFSIALSDITLFVVLAFLIVSLFLLRSGKVHTASIITIFAIFAGMSLVSYLNHGVRDTGVIIYFLLIVFSVLLLGKTMSLIVGGLSIAAIWLMVILDKNPNPYGLPADETIARDLTILIIATVALSYLYDRVLKKYIGEITNSREQYHNLNLELNRRNTEILKKNEELRIAREKAEESDRLKSSFLVNLSHEIRTPMNGIIGFSELVLSPEVPDEEKKEYNSIIGNSCKQLLGVVNDIADISKIESGVLELNIQPVNLNAVLQDVYYLYSLSAKNRGLDFEFFAGLEDEDSMVMVDDIKLKQILGNLIGNALKFTSRGSVNFGYIVKNRKLEFFVTDTGKGIKNEFQKKIFDRFTQEFTSDPYKYGGTGLGLSIAKAYVEKMGGEIWVQSTINKGSKFYFTLPFENIHSKGKIEGSREISVDNRQKIMIVEDIELNEILLRKLIEKYDFEVVSASTGEDALELYEKTPDLDIIFMDIKLPGIDGYEVTRRIRMKDKEIKIIAQTAYAFAGDRDIAKASGCDDIVTKPLTQGSIDEVLQKYIN